MMLYSCTHMATVGVRGLAGRFVFSLSHVKAHVIITLCLSCLFLWSCYSVSYSPIGFQSSVMMTSHDLVRLLSRPPHTDVQPVYLQSQNCSCSSYSSVVFTLTVTVLSDTSSVTHISSS